MMWVTQLFLRYDPDVPVKWVLVLVLLLLAQRC